MSPTTSSVSTTEWAGSIFTSTKEDNTFRIAFQNTNSLGSNQYHHNIQEFASTQQQLQIDYAGITEHCLNINQPKVLNNIQKSLNRHHRGQYAIQMNSANMNTVTPYLPGGTAALLMGHHVTRIDPFGRGGDQHGRWSYITLRRKQLPPLTIYTVYKVNKHPTNQIGITAWHQQRLILDDQQRHREHPREAFTSDLIQAIHHHQSQHHQIIVGGDFNDTLYTNQSQLLRLANATHLTDPWTAYYPQYETFNSYQRGSTRIDAVLISHDLVDTIRKIGYSPFNWLATSDHRALLIDFDEKMLFHDSTITTHSPLLRGLKSNDKQQVETFITQCHEHLTKNGAFDRINALKDDHLSPTQVEILDKLLGQSFISAENKCRRRRNPFYTTRLPQLRTLRSIALGNFNSIKHGTSKTFIFQGRLNRHGIIYTLADTLQESWEQYKSLATELREIIQQHRTLRIKEQETMIEQANLTGKKDKEKVIRNIAKQEARRHTWQTLRYVRMQQGLTQRLDRIEIPSTWPPPFTNITSTTTLEDPKLCTEWITVTEADEVEYYLLLRNRSHFGQADGTPFTRAPFSDSISWSATTSYSDDILAGTAQAHLDDVPQCSALLQACKAASELDVLPSTITENEFRGKIISWKESTSTSPSGRHLGIYKSLFASGPYRKNEEDEEENDKYYRLRHAQQDIAQIILEIINFCLRTGHILERWKTIVNTMIFKDVGNYKIHRLRVIHIYEADFNLLLAIKWRQLLYAADQRHLINPGLFGGRPGCEAQSLPFLEELKYDISYTARRTLFNFDNDATSCYDRIIVSLASLINRKYGLNRAVTLVHANTLQQARFHLRTQLGFSDKFYTHSARFPIYGSGQGSGNSPSIWLFISSTLCDVHNNLSHGAQFTSPDGQDNIKISMVGFVDDSTGTSNDFSPQTEAATITILRQMQYDAQIWNDLLWCSGGKLELSKCSFHTLIFESYPDGSARPIMSRYPHPINLKDSLTNEIIAVPSKSADDPHKTLGHWKAPAEPRQTTQLNTLISKAQTIATLIHLSKVSRFGATLAYHGIYLTSLKYVLPQCFFTPHALQKAERKTTSLIVAKCGYNRHTSLALRYAPLTHAGCGFVRWQTLQGEGQIALFLKHWRTNTIISQVLRIALAWCQWQSGISKCILQDTRTNLPHLSSRWMISLRRFLQSIAAKLKLHEPPVTPPERIGDIYIMEFAIRSNHFNEDELKIINYCRQHLHVTTISELFDASGKKLLPHIIRCRRPPWIDKKQYCILQHRPSAYQIRHKWLKLLRTLTNRDNTPKQFLKFSAWTHTGLRLRSSRESYLCLMSMRLYHWHDDSYWSLNPSCATNQIHYQLCEPTTWRPSDADHPVQIQRIPNKDGSNSYAVDIPSDLLLLASTRPTSTPPFSPPTFYEYLKTIPKMDYYLLKHTTFPICARTTMQSIQLWSSQGITLFEVSDGSMTNQSLSFGWVLGNKKGDKLAWGKGPGYGTDTSHRAEGWGKLAAAKFLYHLSIFTSQPYPQSTRLISFADNKGLINTLQKRSKYSIPYPNICLKPDWDLTEEIYQTYILTAITDVTFSWVKGHQDSTKALGQLSVEARFNIDADKLAEDYMKANSRQRPISPLTNSARCNLIIKGASIHGHYTTAIRDASCLPEYYGYLRSKFRWTKETLSTINWNWFQIAARNYQHTDNHLMKLVYDQLPTRYVKSKKTGQSWIPETCRFCEIEPETFDHLLKCNHNAGKAFRKALPRSVRTYCASRGVPHNFQVTIITILEDWIRDKPPLQAVTNRPSVQALAKAQARIGWSRFLKGFLSKQWKVYLDHEFNALPQHTTDQSFDVDSFFTGLIKTIWHQQSQFWLSHQKEAHTPSSPAQDPILLQELRLEIHHLHSLKGQVLAQHRETYFPTNLTQFLQTSTASQLRTYITNYKPAIHQSIKRAKQLYSNSKKIHQFPGFSYTTKKPPSSNLQAHDDPRTLPTGALPNTTHSPSTNALHQTTLPQLFLPQHTPALNNPYLPPTHHPRHTRWRQQETQQPPSSHEPFPSNQREKNHRKHSRWKASQPMQDRFKAYFTSLTQLPTTHQPT